VLLGHPLGHTLSPSLHGAALASAGRDIRYEALDVLPAQLDEALDRLIDEGAAGNVTLPHKPAVAARCVSRSDVAERAGAVNTFWSDDGAIFGHNTDVGGFDASARALLDGEIAGAVVAVLGAGGAAGGVLTALQGWPLCEVRVWARARERAAALTARFPSGIVAESTADAIDGATLVINATPLGLRESDPQVADVTTFPAGSAVLDLVYRRGETSWVHAARARGLRASDGLPMLVEQAALAQERWFDTEADREAMWRAVGGRPGWMVANR
jgi:shikimate dehydrogenase